MLGARGVAGLLGAVGLLALAPPATAGGGGEPFVPGSGTARSQMVRLAPHTGGLTLAVSTGVALASYEGIVGKAQAQSLDLGLLGLLLTASPSCADNMPRPPGQPPQPVRANSASGPPSASRTYVGGNLAAGGSETASAEPSAAATAQAVGASIELPGFVRIEGGSSAARTRLVPGRRREAYAEARIATVRVADGQVELRGLRWEVTQHTGEAPVATGTFHIDEVSIAGVPVPAGAGDGLVEALRQTREALAPLGMAIEVPAVRPGEDGTVVVTPLRLSMGGETELSSPVGQLLGAAQPARDALAEQLKGERENCRDPRTAFGPAVGGGLLVADLAVAPITGTGGVDIELGGVQAMTEGRVYDSPFGPGRRRPLAPAPAPPVPRAPTSVEDEALAFAPVGPLPALAGISSAASPGGVVSEERSTRRCASAHPVRRPACSRGSATVAGAASLVVASALFAGDALLARRRRRTGGAA